MLNSKKTGFIIPLAWGETYCKQAGAWYDGLMNLLGFAKENYYKVGHAGIVLIDSQTGKCHYFDFGRYHTPFGQGRVRNTTTDHDLNIPIIAQIADTRILNFDKITAFLSNNDACHGTGKMEASYCAIDFEKAYERAMSLQNQSPIAYGPFIWNGTNCSRFVRTVALAGEPPFGNWLKLFLPLTISPTPTWNVRVLTRPTQSEDNLYETLSTAQNYACETILTN